jgi:hypothetical protein
MRSDELELALAFAAANYPVFPVDIYYDPDSKRWRKKPCIKNWEARATTNADTILGWWRGWPGAMPGIPPGRINKVIVDADRHPGCVDGVELFRELDRSHGPFPPHPIVVTKSGGEHHWFSQPQSIRIQYAQWKGGEVHGHRRFVVGYALPVGAMPELPAVFCRLGPTHMGVTIPRSSTCPMVATPIVCAGGAFTGAVSRYEKNYAFSALRNAAGELWGCRRGSRNIKLNALAYKMGRLMARGWITLEQIEQFLMKACEKNGLLAEDGIEQCRKTLASGLNAGARRPYHDVRTEWD